MKPSNLQGIADQVLTDSMGFPFLVNPSYAQEVAKNKKDFILIIEEPTYLCSEEIFDFF